MSSQCIIFISFLKANAQKVDAITMNNAIIVTYKSLKTMDLLAYFIKIIVIGINSHCAT